MSKQTEPVSAFAPASGYASPCGRVTLYLGDCLALRDKIPADAAIISDPPYGMAWNTDSTRFTGGGQKRGEGRSDWAEIHHDDEPFDPSAWVTHPQVVLFGWNHFAARLAVGTTLIWEKKHEHLFGTFLSDAEIAWMKGGHGVYVFKKSFPPPARIAEYFGGRAAHPTQKPIALMEWCMEKAKVPPGATVCDPYMGSGTTGIACIRTGRKFIGIEKDPTHFAVAVERIKRELMQGDLFEMHTSKRSNSVGASDSRRSCQI